ncbi:DUF309 domain-containing protein [Deinococcus deserti]|uniref:DUF309 domain-containing protein n=1 Tax=Deinococcus deserti (strain DSM 17065 / CIP 109153 / LMG 22923 / VCD115) TaxID=546414 RepID=C1CXD0_DEIDV|nr:DUF309 domain-containing protein [Deinococcus deserti]ACO46847.1 hypothetical protein Deide_18590 [Deinococcus deserti VCD115]
MTSDSATRGGQDLWASGVTLFNAGHWWEAHEAWEPLWLQSTGPERHFLQGVILLAAALHKRWVHGSLTHRNYHKAVKHLEQLPPGYAARTRGVDLAALRQEVWEALHDSSLRPVLPLPDGSGIL